MTKKCSVCGKEKPLTEFRVRYDRPSLRNRCKPCDNAINRERRAKASGRHVEPESVGSFVFADELRAFIDKYSCLPVSCGRSTVIGYGRAGVRYGDSIIPDYVYGDETTAYVKRYVGNPMIVRSYYNLEKT